MARTMSRKQRNKYPFMIQGDTHLSDEKIHERTCVVNNLPPFQILSAISIGDYWHEHDFRNFTGRVFPIGGRYGYQHFRG